MRNRNILYIILLLLLCALITLAAVNHELITYLYFQGKGQIAIITNARPSNDFLLDTTLAIEKRAKIVEINEIKNFAVKKIGLKDNGSYTKIFDQKGKPLLWVVTACPPYSLKPYKWKFPFVGSFAYKGFFNPIHADKEAKRLKKRGFDVRIRNANAWSTLGIFKDPIFTGMLSRSEGALAELIIHEMTHATIFVKDDMRFNENLATFIGDNGAIFYLEQKYGLNSKELDSYIYSLEDYELFSDRIVRGANELEKLYASFDQNLSKEEKDKKKEKLISEIVTDIKGLPFNNKKRYERYKDFKPNNAWFASYIRYRADLSQFETQFKEEFDSDFKKYISFLKKKYK